MAKADAIPPETQQPQGAAPSKRTSARAIRKVSRLGQNQSLERLGGGGMGDVYKARHAKLERVVAVKVLSKQLTKDPARWLASTAK